VPEVLVRARGLTKRFGSFTAVDGIDFDLFRGEAFGFLGPNGAGKSSTMRMLGCVSPPTSGDLTILGADPVRDGAAIRARLGVVPQEDTLDSELTVRDNLLVGAYRRGGDVAARMSEVIDIFPRLGERLAQNAETLSGGEQQMLALGRGLMMDPVLMLLDEPSQGLSPVMVDLVIESIRAIRDRNVTILLVEQVPDLHRRVCDEVLFVAGGRVSAPANPAVLTPALMQELLTEGKIPQIEPLQPGDSLAQPGKVPG
jgi:lipooligosaccharide transport system ATP-binding protein